MTYLLGGTGASSGTSPSGGPIRLTFAVKGSCGVINNIRTSHPGIGSASLGSVYGPLEPGSWEGSFDWKQPENPRISADFKYRLVRPASGFKRSYVITLVTDTVSGVGCRYSADNAPFTDEKAAP